METLFKGLNLLLQLNAEEQNLVLIYKRKNSVEILTFKEIKKLQNLFSWAQFYQNSEQLAISRYPRHYYYEYGKKCTLMPENDVIRYNNVQQEIKLIGNK